MVDGVCLVCKSAKIVKKYDPCCSQQCLTSYLWNTDIFKKKEPKKRKKDTSQYIGKGQLLLINGKTFEPMCVLSQKESERLYYHIDIAERRYIKNGGFKIKPFSKEFINNLFEYWRMNDDRSTKWDIIKTNESL